MSEHTKEPWKAWTSNSHIRIGSNGMDGDVVHATIASDGLPVLAIKECDAIRIVDCVNACVGADKNTLTAIEATGGLGEFFKNVEQVSKDHDQLNAKAAVLGESNENWMEGFEAVKTQRDELLAALKELVALHEPEGRFQPHHFKTPVRNAMEVIAKAEAK
jgi:hypothetical protein